MRRPKEREPLAPAGHGAPRWRPWLLGLGLVLLVVAVYVPTLDNGFVWDDDDYVTENATLASIEGLRAIWTDPAATPQYYPLVHTTYWLEHARWGLSPRGYHAVNLLLHAVSVLLVWRLLLSLEVPGAWLAAALFAVHPICVESVAWVTERKNVLSCAFALASILAYLRFSPAQVDAENAPSSPAWRYYFLSLTLFAAALLSKTVTASVPAVLLVIFWWKRGRITWREAARLAPFFAIGLVMAGVTATMERTQVGARGEEWSFSLAERVLIAGRALWFYAAKLAWPNPLIFFYPRWIIDQRQVWQYLYPAAALAVVVALWLLRGRIGRGPLAAVLLFAGVLVPALGFVDVYPFRYSFVADHFQYHAAIALFALAAAGAAMLGAAVARGRRWVDLVIGLALLLPLAFVAHQRTKVYHDRETLHADTLAQNSKAWNVPLNLGYLEYERGNYAKAIPLLRQAVEIREQQAKENPGIGLFREGVAHCLNQLAAAEFKAGQTAQAEASHLHVIEIREQLVQENPKSHEYKNKLAAAYVEMGLLLNEISRPADAEAFFDRALAIREQLARDEPADEEIQKDLAWVYVHRGLAELRQGKSAEAVDSCRQALAVRRKLVERHPANLDYQARVGESLIDLGLRLREIGQTAAALEALQEAIKVREALVSQDSAKAKYLDDLAWAHIQVALTQQKAGKRDEAIAAHRRGLEIRERLARKHPEQADYRNSIAASQVDLAVLERELGHQAEADAALEAAIEIREQLVSEHPSKADYAVGLGACYELLSTAQRNQGKTDESLSSRLKSLELFGQLVKTFPQVDQYQAFLATGYADVAGMQRAAGKTAEAEAAWKQVIALRRPLVEKNPTVGILKHQLATALIELGILRRERGVTAEAEQCSRQAVELYEAMTPEQAANAEYLGGLAWAQLNLGIAQMLAGRPAEAAAACQKSVDIREQLVRAREELDDVKLSLESALGWSYANLGAAHYFASQWDAAEAAFRRAIHVRAKLIQDNPRAIAHQDEIAQSCRDLGMVQLAKGQLQEALEFFLASVEIREMLVTTYPENASYRAPLARDLASCGDTLAQLGRWSESAAMLQRGTQAGDDSIHSKCALALVKLGADNLSGYREACAIVERRYAAAPQDAEAVMLWTLLLGEASLPDMQGVLKRAERARAANPQSWQLELLAAVAQVRAGGSSEALQSLLAAPRATAAHSALDEAARLGGQMVLAQADPTPANRAALEQQRDAVEKLSSGVSRLPSSPPTWLVALTVELAARQLATAPAGP